MTQSCYLWLFCRYGDSLKSGWKNMMECVVRLFKLNMLPESILLMEAEDPESARRRIPRPSNKARNSSAGSIISRAFSNLISLEGADSGPPGESSPREVEATQRSVSCLNACRVEDIFADSKFLRAESLHELVKAIMWASGPIKRVASSGEESETAQANTLFTLICGTCGWVMTKMHMCPLKYCVHWMWSC